LQEKLQDGVKAWQKPAAAGLPWPQHDQPVMVLPVVGVEEQAKRGKAKVRLHCVIDSEAALSSTAML
jgi:hypothetical protein